MYVPDNTLFPIYNKSAAENLITGVMNSLYFVQLLSTSVKQKQLEPGPFLFVLFKIEDGKKNSSVL